MTEQYKNGLSIGNKCNVSRVGSRIVWYIACASQFLHTQSKLGIRLKN